MPKNNREHTVGTLIAVAQRLGAQEVNAARAVAMAREGKTFTDIGAELLPNIDVRLAQMAIARALREVLDPPEYELLRNRNMVTGTIEGGFAMFPEGTDRDERLVAPCECKSHWEDDELTELVRLTLDPTCRFVAGPYKGQTSWRVVAQRLNEVYGERRPMRNANACMRRFKRLLSESVPTDTISKSEH
jgi:hypothetical protein